MALQKISQFRNNAFEKGSKPQIETIVGWIQSGELYGRKLGGLWYVDPDILMVPDKKPKPNLSDEAMELIQQVQAS